MIRDILYESADLEKSIDLPLLKTRALDSKLKHRELLNWGAGQLKEINYLFKVVSWI